MGSTVWQVCNLCSLNEHQERQLTLVVSAQATSEADKAAAEHLGTTFFAEGSQARLRERGLGAS